MVTEEYQIAYAQVLEIINNIPFVDYAKIPIKKIQLFKKYAKKEIKFNYNPELSLAEQNVSEKAKIIIALLFRDYWATPLQREKILAKEKIDRQKLEEEKREKYNTENIFLNNKAHNYKEVKEEYSLLDIKNEKWYKKIFLFFRKFFK